MKPLIRITIDLADVSGTTVQAAFLAKTKADAKRITGAAAVLGLTPVSLDKVSPDEPLFSGRSSRDGDYCFQLMTMDEVRKFLPDDGVVALTTEGRYEYDGSSRSANVKRVGTAAEVLAAQSR